MTVVRNRLQGVQGQTYVRWVPTSRVVRLCCIAGTTWAPQRLAFSPPWASQPSKCATASASNRFWSVLLFHIRGRLVQVHGQPHVAIMSTGDEVQEPSTRDLGPGQIRDANRCMLLAAARSIGALVGPPHSLILHCSLPAMQQSL